MVETYGDVTGEYLALRRESGLVEGQHGMVWVRGPEARSFLEGLLTQHLEQVPPGAVARSLLLAPQGKLRATLWVLRGDQDVGLITELERREVLVGDLERFRIRVKAVVEPEPAPVLELWGPGSNQALEAARLPIPEGWVAGDEVTVARAPLANLTRYFLTGIEPGALMAAGARPVGSLAATAVRVEAGEPRMGVDIDEATIPQESGLVPETVSFDKGCFLGYELVARIDSRGRVNRHLRGVEIRENVRPPEGAELVAGGRVVGRLSSLAESLTLRAPVGLALVRREIEPGEEVELRWEGGSAPAVLRALPMDDFSDPPAMRISGGASA
ncbi:MAG: hypothetical protein M3N51_12520 [Actinomycetota bacterium]|nr:hypothetical protein [Actinomycetota bacterium]